MHKHFRSWLAIFIPVVAHQLIVVVLPAPDASYWYVGLLFVLLNISTTILPSSGVACQPFGLYLAGWQKPELSSSDGKTDKQACQVDEGLYFGFGQLGPGSVLLRCVTVLIGE
jgi:hypothetical protein